jgi:hypothetical protein
MRALEETRWNRKRATRLLGISYRGLLYKIRQHGITQNEGDHDAELAQNTPQGGEVALPGTQPLASQTMQRLQLLLLEALDRYLTNLRAACGFDQCGGIGSIGLAASDVRLHVMRGQKPHRVTLADEAPRPVVSTAAGFHNHLARWTVHKEPDEPRTVQSVPLDNTPLTVGYGEFENVLCQFNRDSRRVHAWTPSGKGFSCDTKLSLAHRCRTAIQEESISTLGAARDIQSGALCAPRLFCAHSAQIPPARGRSSATLAVM